MQNWGKSTSTNLKEDFWPEGRVLVNQRVDISGTYLVVFGVIKNYPRSKGASYRGLGIIVCRNQYLKALRVAKLLWTLWGLVTPKVSSGLRTHTSKMYVMPRQISKLTTFFGENNFSCAYWVIWRERQREVRCASGICTRTNIVCGLSKMAQNSAK